MKITAVCAEAGFVLQHIVLIFKEAFKKKGHTKFLPKEGRLFPKPNHLYNGLGMMTNFFCKTWEHVQSWLTPLLTPLWEHKNLGTFQFLRPKINQIKHKSFGLMLTRQINDRKEVLF